MALTDAQAKLLNEILINYGFSDIDYVRKSDGHTPLSLALSLISGNAIIAGKSESESVAQGKLAFGLLSQAGADFMKPIPAMENNNAVGVAAALALIKQFETMVKEKPEALTTAPNNLPFVLAMLNYPNRPDAMKLFIQYFVKNGVFNDVGGQKPSIIAAMNGARDVLDAILEVKPEWIKEQDSKNNGYHALTLAAIQAQKVPACESVIGYLVQNKGFPVDSLNIVGDTALQIAACQNSFVGARVLLANGANPNIEFMPNQLASPVNNGRTPFMLSCNVNKTTSDVAKANGLAIAKVILSDARIDVSKKSASGNTYLHYAAMTNDKDLVSKVEAKYKDAHSGASLLNVKNHPSHDNLKYGTLTSDATPLEAVSAEGIYSVDMMKHLVSMGADVNGEFNKYIMTSLTNPNISKCTIFTAACQGYFYSKHDAIKASFLEKAKYILTLDTFTNYEFIDNDGFNSIGWALSFGSAALVHKVLEKAAKVCDVKTLLNSTDKIGKALLKWELEYWRDSGKSEEHTKILKELKIHGASFAPAKDFKCSELDAILQSLKSEGQQEQCHQELITSYDAATLGAMPADPDDLYA